MLSFIINPYDQTRVFTVFLNNDNFGKDIPVSVAIFCKQIQIVDRANLNLHIELNENTEYVTGSAAVDGVGIPSVFFENGILTINTDRILDIGEKAYINFQVVKK